MLRSLLGFFLILATVASPSFAHADEPDAQSQLRIAMLKQKAADQVLEADSLIAFVMNQNSFSTASDGNPEQFLTSLRTASYQDGFLVSNQSLITALTHFIEAYQRPSPEKIRLFGTANHQLPEDAIIREQVAFVNQHFNQAARSLTQQLSQYLQIEAYTQETATVRNQWRALVKPRITEAVQELQQKVANKRMLLPEDHQFLENLHKLNNLHLIATTGLVRSPSDLPSPQNYRYSFHSQVVRFGRTAVRTCRTTHSAPVPRSIFMGDG